MSKVIPWIDQKNAYEQRIAELEALNVDLAHEVELARLAADVAGVDDEREKSLAMIITELITAHDQALRAVHRLPRQLHKRERDQARRAVRVLRDALGAHYPKKGAEEFCGYYCDQWPCKASRALADADVRAVLDT